MCAFHEKKSSESGTTTTTTFSKKNIIIIVAAQLSHIRKQRSWLSVSVERLGIVLKVDSSSAHFFSWDGTVFQKVVVVGSLSSHVVVCVEESIKAPFFFLLGKKNSSILFVCVCVEVEYFIFFRLERAHTKTSVEQAFDQSQVWRSTGSNLHHSTSLPLHITSAVSQITCITNTEIYTQVTRQTETKFQLQVIEFLVPGDHSQDTHSPSPSLPNLSTHALLCSTWVILVCNLFPSQKKNNWNSRKVAKVRNKEWLPAKRLFPGIN